MESTFQRTENLPNDILLSSNAAVFACSPGAASDETMLRLCEVLGQEIRDARLSNQNWIPHRGTAEAACAATTGLTSSCADTLPVFTGSFDDSLLCALRGKKGQYHSARHCCQAFLQVLHFSHLRSVFVALQSDNNTVWHVGRGKSVFTHGSVGFWVVRRSTHPHPTLSAQGAAAHRHVSFELYCQPRSYV